MLTGIVGASGTARRGQRLADGRALAIALTVRLETPGEACVAIVTGVAIDWPGLPEEVALRLDDRLYDGLYDGLAAVEGDLPPGRLRVSVTALDAEPALASALPPGDWLAVAALGDTLAALAAEATGVAWAGLRAALS